jgi:hypothetical protein
LTASDGRARLSEVADPDELVLLTTCSDSVEPMSIRAMLEAEGIEVLVQGEHHRAQLGFLGSYVDLRVMVRARDLEDARELLEEAAYAEHLPPDEAPDGVHEAVDDLSMRHFRERVGELPDESSGDAVDEVGSVRPRPIALAAILACTLTFGTGHMVARRWSTAAVLAITELFLIGMLLGGRPVAGIAIAGLVFYDAIGGTLAVRRHNAALLDRAQR